MIPLPEPIAYDAADPDQVGRAEETARTARAQAAEDLGRVLESEAGRRFVWRVLEAAHCFQISHGPDPYATAFREGERNVGLPILAEILATRPDAFIRMARENRGGPGVVETSASG